MKKTNKLLALILVVTLIFGATAYASFPVKNETKKEQTSKENAKQDFTVTQESAANAQLTLSADNNTATAPTGMDQETIILLVLWFFLGGLAAHRWYKGKPVGWNILFILTGGGCGIWWVVDLINIITGKF